MGCNLAKVAWWFSMGGTPPALHLVQWLLCCTAAASLGAGLASDNFLATLFAAVVPRESAWFGFWDGKSLIPLQDQALFTDDWLGLKKLHDAGNLLFDSAPGEHMQFTLSWFNDNIVQKYLAGTKPQPEPQPEPQPSN
jgi:hypothetical protein